MYLIILLEKNCGTPADISGGNVSYTTTDYYSSAIYTCQKGHDLINNGFIQRSGRYTVRCQSTGIWALAPTCRRKLLSTVVFIHSLDIFIWECEFSKLVSQKIGRLCKESILMLFIKLTGLKVLPDVAIKMAKSCTNLQDTTLFIARSVTRKRRYAS